MKEKLVFEIGTEELPPSCAFEGSTGLKKILGNKLSENRLEFTYLKTYSSPRRLVAVVGGLSDVQKSEEKTVTGPLAKIAFDESGNPTRSAEGFAKSLGLKVSQLEKIKVEGKGVYLGKRIVEKGKKTADILPEILKETILAMTFKKQMTWGDYELKFARPIRWILTLYGDDVIRFKLANLNSSNITFGHRTLGPGPIAVKDSDSYFKLLKDKGKVIADAEKRKKMILDQISKIEEKIWKGKYRVVLNHDLIDDVVNMVEIPNVIAGDFPEKFLYMPKELLIEAIQYHQRYFAVLGNSGRVSTKFIVVQNGVRDNGEIRKGNERVLKARLSDASFFYEEDKKHDFDYWIDKLKGVVFFSRLGSIYDKAVRIKKASIYMAKLLGGSKTRFKEDISVYLDRAGMLCKCDLVTNMVVEFPALQGVVGREYAKEKGESREVSDAIFEHYLPRFSGDILPETDTGTLLSVADKIDTITGMFLAGKIPSGSEDPFALRRKASGIVLSVLEKKYDFNLESAVKYELDLYTKSFKLKNESGLQLITKIKDFIISRYRFLLEKEKKRSDILESILGSGCSSITDIDLRYRALQKFMSDSDIKRLAFPMIRCKNITGDKESGKVNPKFFKEEYEKKLFSSAGRYEASVKELVSKKDYGLVLAGLEEFGKTVDLFFDNVLVMEKDRKIRTNRINLVRKVVNIYLMFADFSKLVIEGSDRG
jgi:glycyl-tRNA synthetase beta chain